MGLWYGQIDLLVTSNISGMKQTFQLRGNQGCRQGGGGLGGLKPPQFFHYIPDLKHGRKT